MVSGAHTPTYLGVTKYTSEIRVVRYLWLPLGRQAFLPPPRRQRTTRPPEGRAHLLAKDVNRRHQVDHRAHERLWDEIQKRLVRSCRIRNHELIFESGLHHHLFGATLARYNDEIAVTQILEARDTSAAACGFPNKHAVAQITQPSRELLHLTHNVVAKLLAAAHGSC